VHYRSQRKRKETDSPAKNRVRGSAAGAPDDGPGMVEYGFWAFVFIGVGRINQLIPGLSAVPLAKVVMAVTVLALIRNRRPLPPINPDARAIGMSAIGLAVLAAILTPFSFWRGASLNFTLIQLPVIGAGCVLAYFMCSSWKRLRGTFLVLVLCALTLARGAVSGYSGGRAGDDGTMYDPNDLAYLLVTLTPLAMAFFLAAKSVVPRVLFAVTLATLIGATLLTQSRGGLLGLLTIVALMTVVPMKVATSKGGKQSARGFGAKLGVLILVVGLGLATWSHLPPSAQQRFATLLNLGSDYNLDPNDRNGRGEIWRRGLTAASQRPLGYGPQSYMMVDVSLGGKFNGAHNSYLQALVELGVLGLLLFVRMYYLSFRGLQRARAASISGEVITPEKAEQALFARALQFALAGNMVCVFFLTEIYMQLLWVTFGVCMALLTLASPGAVKSASARRMPAKRLNMKYLPSVRRSGGLRSGETINETQDKS
jgi:putative inorganic carbon (HCO3(-)) transporter